MKPANRLVFVRVQASGHYFVVLFFEGLEQHVYRQVFLWAFDPCLPWFTWVEADLMLRQLAIAETFRNLEKG